MAPELGSRIAGETDGGIVAPNRRSRVRTTARFRSRERNAHLRGLNRPHCGAGAAGGIPADATIRTSRLQARLPCGRIGLGMTRDCRALNEGALFVMPFCDAYWSRLLGTMATEIEALLLAARQDRYIFIDCGANFGSWSVLASSRSFGPSRRSRSRHLALTCSISTATQNSMGIASAVCTPPSAAAAVALCASPAQAVRTWAGTCARWIRSNSPSEVSCRSA